MTLFLTRTMKQTSSPIKPMWLSMPWMMLVIAVHAGSRI